MSATCATSFGTRGDKRRAAFIDLEAVKRLLDVDDFPQDEPSSAGGYGGAGMTTDLPAVQHRVSNACFASGIGLMDSQKEACMPTAEPVRLRDEGDPPPLPEPPAKPRDPRLPPVGTVIHRAHKGEVHEITVLDDGFEYEGRHYTSLSTIAREVTGTSWNGFLWAGLCRRKARKAGGRRLQAGGDDA